jgi:hypothetical protein
VPHGVAATSWLHADGQQTAALYRAIMLAPSLPICEALLRRETVPVGRLDPEWVARLGRR